jgi:hypothetical protein
MREAGNLQNLYVRVFSNSISGGTSTFVMRDNAATIVNGEALSISASATGEFEDISAQDTITAGHRYNLMFTPGDTTHNLSMESARVLFNTTTNTATRLACSSGAGGVGFSAASTTYYHPVHGSIIGTANTSEANMKCRQRIAGTMQNLFIVTSGYTRTVSPTLVSRIDTGSGSANGNMSISITGNGLFEDTTVGHTDSVAAGNDFNTAFTTGSDTGHGVNLFIIGMSYLSTSGFTYCCTSYSTGALPNSTSAKYYTISGTMLGISALETTTAPVKAGENKQFSQMTIFLSASSGTGTMKFRKNAANGSQSVSTTGTGNFTDTVNIDYVVSSDEINYSFTPGASSGVTVQNVASWAVKGTNIPLTETATLAGSPKMMVGRSGKVIFAHTYN